ncbi:MAG: Gfo/Idh/MocA family oxidoreductase, partial [Planctomycetales bacterium]
MANHLSRRTFLQASALATAGMTTGSASAAEVKSPNEKVNLAGVGVGGKGWSDLNAASAGHNVIAFCDVDQSGNKRRGGFAAAAKQWPKARRYTDWREMLDKEAKHLDGVTVSTPDHMHAPVTMTAMHLGLGVYTQKPLTRTMLEARRLTEHAKKSGVVTQMGNQHHSGSPYRTLVHMIQDGVLGKIKEAHAWSNRPIWPQGIDRPAGSHAVPKGFNWDLWLGVAAERPYVKETYHPFKWRGWYDFGAGALGDMGCHIIDPVVWALELGPPTSVGYEGPEPNKETFPAWEVLNYEFPGTKFTADKTFRATWRDGGKLPPEKLALLPKGQSLPANGTLFVGEKGTVVTPHGKPPKLFPQEKFADFEIPTVEGDNHYLQWTNAIRGEGKTTANFGYAGPLTETVLLGVVASRFPSETLRWDSDQFKVLNVPAANDYLQEDYR